jgi:hypothetical protein
MKDEEARDLFLRLMDSDKQIYLAMLSHDLTIHGRAFTLDLSEQQQLMTFRGLNEIQHQISSHIAALGMGCDRYPDDVVWKILAETAAAHGLGTHLRSSIQRTASTTYWNKPQ